MSEQTPENVFNSAMGNVLSTFHAVVDEARNPRHEYQLVLWAGVAALAAEGWQMQPGGIVQPLEGPDYIGEPQFVMFRQVSPAEQAAEQIARQAAAAPRDFGPAPIADAPPDTAAPLMSGDSYRQVFRP